MTAMQLNADLFRELSLIAEDEDLMAKVVKYVKKLTAKKHDPTLMTREEFLARVDRANQGELYEQQPGESLAELIRRVG